MSKKIKNSEKRIAPAPIHGILPKPAREYPESEQKLFIAPNRYGKTEFECQKCKNNWDMQDMYVEAKYYENFTTYTTFCPDPTCNALFFSQMVNIVIKKDTGQVIPERKINPELDCPPDCVERDKNCNLVNGCPRQKDFEKLRNIMRGTKPGIVTGSETTPHDWWIHGLMARDRDIEQGEVIVQNCDNCRQYFDPNHIRCITCQIPTKFETRMFHNWIGRKEMHRFPCPCPYCKETNPGWLSLDSRPYLTVDYPEPAKHFSQMCLKCRLIHDVDLTSETIRKMKEKHATEDFNIALTKNIIRGNNPEKPIIGLVDSVKIIEKKKKITMRLF